MRTELTQSFTGGGFVTSKPTLSDDPTSVMAALRGVRGRLVTSVFFLPNGFAMCAGEAAARLLGSWRERSRRVTPESSSFYEQRCLASACESLRFFRRHVFGVSLTHRRKSLQRCDWFAKPQASAI
jgi:hypothetical protein